MTTRQHGYFILRRYPTEFRGGRIAGPFASIGEARALILARIEEQQEPEGTLLYITHQGPGPNSIAGLKESYTIERYITKAGYISYRQVKNI